MTPDFNEWAKSGTQTWPQTLKGILGHLIHQTLPRITHSQPSLIAIFVRFPLFWLLPNVGIATSPFWIEYYQAREIDITLIWLSALIVAFMLLKGTNDWLVGKGKSIRLRRDNEATIANRQTAAFKSLVELLGSAARDEANGEQRRELIGKLLNCIVQAAQNLLREDGKPYFNASLLLFETDENGEIWAKVFQRAKNDRDDNVSVRAERAIAAHIAAYGHETKALHDFRDQKFKGFSGLSKQETPYRSILFSPIQRDGRVKGVVTIDASKPFEFWGTRESDLFIRINPYITLIDILLDEQSAIELLPTALGVENATN